MTTCPILFMWIAATGPVESYDFIVDDEVVSQGPTNAGETCITDDLPHTFRVVAYGRNEDGLEVAVAGDPVTDTIEGMIASRPGWTPTPVPTASPTPQPTVSATPTPRAAVGCGALPVVCHDVDQNGVVGWSDFFSFSANFGHRNDGTSEVP